LRAEGADIDRQVHIVLGDRADALAAVRFGRNPGRASIRFPVFGLQAAIFSSPFVITASVADTESGASNAVENR
jgi:hypothetical protein